MLFVQTRNRFFFEKNQRFSFFGEIHRLVKLEKLDFRKLWKTLNPKPCFFEDFVQTENTGDTKEKSKNAIATQKADFSKKSVRKKTFLEKKQNWIALGRFRRKFGNRDPSTLNTPSINFRLRSLRIR